MGVRHVRYRNKPVKKENFGDAGNQLCSNLASMTTRAGGAKHRIHRRTVTQKNWA